MGDPKKHFLISECESIAQWNYVAFNLIRDGG